MIWILCFHRWQITFHFFFIEILMRQIWGGFSAFLMCKAAIAFWTWCDSNMITFFYCKTDNLSCLNKTNWYVNSKDKELFMCFYVICMNKHVGITLSVFLLDIYTGALGTDHTPFTNFRFTNLFSLKFLYFFIISSLFPYFNLFVSIFIRSYANIKLHVSTL